MRLLLISLPPEGGDCGNDRDSSRDERDNKRFERELLAEEGGKAAPVGGEHPVAAVREELRSELDPPYRVREAVGGRHLSVSVEPVVQSAQQVVAIYRRLAVIDGVVMLF